MTTCSIEGCDKGVHSKKTGWCPKHHQRWVRNGDPLATTRLPNGSHETCVVNDCDRGDIAAHGMCRKHYARHLRHGDTDTSLIDRDPAETRFWKSVDQQPGGCWLWTGHIMKNGYGTHSDGRSILAHRYAYELLAAPIPDGMEIDHLCCVRNCVNPEHLEPVTGAENMRRMSERYQARRSA